MKADTGVSKTYLKSIDSTILKESNKITHGPQVLLQNGADLRIVQTGNIPIHHSLSSDAQKAHILKGLRNSSLLSIGQLCDDDCVAIFTKRILGVCKHGAVVLIGKNNSVDGLWDVHFDTSLTQSLNE